MIPKTIPQSKINAINKEFLKLARGKEIKIKLPPIKSSWSVRIAWEEDQCSQHDYYGDDNSEHFPIAQRQWEAIDSVIKKELAIRQKEYDAKINAFCTKVEKLEQQYGLEKDRIWEDYLWKLDTRVI